MLKDSRNVSDAMNCLKLEGGYVIQTTKGCFITQDKVAEQIFQSKILLDVHSMVDPVELETSRITLSAFTDKAVEVIPVKFAELKGVYCCDNTFFSESVTFGLDYIISVIKY